MGSSNAIAAKAKAMYAKRLKEEDYRTLLKKSSVTEIAAYLKNETEYAYILQNVKENDIHRGQLEKILHNDMYFKEMKLAAYASAKEKEFYTSMIRKIESDLLLLKIRQVSSPLYAEMYQGSDNDLVVKLSFDFDKLKQSETYEDILKVVRRTPYYSVLEKYKPVNNQSIDYASIDKELNKLSNEWMIDVIHRNLKGKVQKDVLTIFLTSVELHIITKIYRLKKYYHADAQTILKQVDFTYTRMSHRQIEELANVKEADEVLLILQKSPYHLYMDEKEYIYIEYYAEKIKYHLAKRYMNFSSSAPLVYMTYIILHQIEIMNLVNIIEGIRYGMNEEKIMKTCIF